jgi:hypothetical protein
MAKVLLLNPRGRKSGRKAPRSAAQRRATAKMLAANRRNRNPAARASANPKKRRAKRNPALRLYARRRRNPISMGGGILKIGTYLGPFKDAAIMGAGAVAMDMGYAYINRMLPAVIQRTPGGVGVGDAVKAALTVVIGNALSGVTKGLSRKAALGALTVQAHGIATNLIGPATVAGLGYVTAGRVVPGNSRVNSNMSANRLSAYVSGPSPTLSAPGGLGMYVGAASPLLSRAPWRR